MLIRCPTCSFGYELPLETLGGPGRILRCAQCRESWTLQPGFDAPEIVTEAQSGRHAPAETHAIFARRSLRAGVSAKRGPTHAVAAALVLGGVGAGMAALAFKDAVVSVLPRSAVVFAAIGLPVHRQGLALGDLHSTVGPDPNGPGQVLTLEGRISNIRRVANQVPQLRVTVRDKSRNALYSWLVPPPRSRLDSGESVSFRSRLLAPPQDGQDVVVSFADTLQASSMETR